MSLITGGVKVQRSVSSNLDVFAVSFMDAVGCSSIIEAIDQAANIGYRGVYSDTPQRLERIAHLNGIKWIYVKSIPFDGILLPLAQGGYVVYLSDKSSPARRRFTLAHEIAHAVLHSLMPSIRDVEHRTLFVPIGSETEELICDSIAGRLLAPDFIIKPLITDQALLSEQVLQIARKCDMSLSAAARRLSEITERRLWIGVSDCSDVSKRSHFKMNHIISSVPAVERLRTSVESCISRGELCRTSQIVRWLPFGPSSKLLCSIDSVLLNNEQQMWAVSPIRHATKVHS